MKKLQFLVILMLLMSCVDSKGSYLLDRLDDAEKAVEISLSDIIEFEMSCADNHGYYGHLYSFPADNQKTKYQQAILASYRKTHNADLKKLKKIKTDIYVYERYLFNKCHKTFPAIGFISNEKLVEKFGKIAEDSGREVMYLQQKGLDFFEMDIQKRYYQAAADGGKKFCR
ncbi:hypothetical protein KBC04_02085 [Candidatus Babeliales bacterium]|nr:hypothetical protein [Candidatus Babeliales bacterium]MBP9843801.1 hypothetical protein [Candidatus Babeliales bacterium]